MQSTYSLPIVTLIYRMWHRKLERCGGELGLGGDGHGFRSDSSVFLTTYSTPVSTTSPLMELNGRR